MPGHVAPVVDLWARAVSGHRPMATPPSLPVLWAPDLGQALGVAIGVSHGPPELHRQLVGADELRQLLLPVACGDKKWGAMEGRGLKRGQWGQAQGET